jgi:alkanesulfonate monooxygenase SsuD/methylene tetrahydromethanopterin reductase-like flavin-dependent oxidoreductase (luciferase family)
VRFGLAILPERPWSEAERQWRGAEELGFDHAWTYDHILWAGLPDSPWYGTTPTLTAAALATSGIGLGTFVSSPNFRHPAVFYRDVQSLDDLSGGRFLLGVGNGADLDSGILGGPTLSRAERVERFQEFTRLLLRLRSEDHVTSEGRWFSSHDMRTLPHLRHVPVLIAANGPRSVRFAAKHGDGWITTGPPMSPNLDVWFDGLAASAAVLDEALTASGRDGAEFRRYVNLDSSPTYSLSSAETLEALVRRAAGLGFTDVISHWPRSSSPYQGDETILETVARQLIPALRDA